MAGRDDKTPTSAPAGEPGVEASAPPRRKNPFAVPTKRAAPKEAWDRRAEPAKAKARAPRLVPPSADVTIPLIDPQLAAPNVLPQAPPRLDAATPVPRPARPPTPMINLPTRKEPTPKAPQHPEMLGSDDEIVEEMSRALMDPDAYQPDAEDDDTDEIIIVPSRWARWRRGWFDPPTAPPDGATGVRLARHLSYEVVVVAVTFLAASILIFTSLNGEVRDLYVQARNAAGMYPAHTSEQVALVTIGKESLYLWNPKDAAPEVTPRALLAELVNVLDAAGAQTVVLDFVLDVPADGDDQLKAAAEAHGAVIAAERAEVTDPSLGAVFSAGVAPSLGDSLHSGVANLGEEELWIAADESMARSAPMIMTASRARLEQAWPTSAGGEAAKSEVTPHLALLAAWTHTRRSAGLPTDPSLLLGELSRGCTTSDSAHTQCTIGLDAVGLPAMHTPLHELMPINFRGPESHDGLSTLRASELLRIAATPALFRAAGVEQPLEVPTWLRDQVEGKLVVVGRVDDAANDRFATPYSFPLPTHADMAGCRIQAQAIDTLLTGRHVRTAPTWLMLLIALGSLTLLFMTARMLREDIHTATWIGVGSLMVVLGCAVFIVTDGLVLNLSVPLTSVILGIVFARLRGWAID